MTHGKLNAQTCWKCGQRVRHVRAWWYIIRWFDKLGDPGVQLGPRAHDVVPIKHYVEKNGRFTVCKGSEALS